jgi:tetratricopeptide (TPR) repeat protein
MIRKLCLWLVLAIVSIAPGAAHAEWRQYETAHFVIYSEAGEKDVGTLAERLESVDGLLRLATGLGDNVDPVKVRIYHVATDEQVERALGLKDSGVAGFYDSNVLGPFLVTPRKTYFRQADFTPELVLHHEYAHHFMLQYFPAIYPSWYVEGFAELIGSSRFMDDGRIAYGMPAKHRGESIAFSWISLEDLLTKPPEKIHGFDLYGQGWAMTHFFTFSKTRAPQMRKFLQGLRAGKPQAQAAKEAFGDLAALNREAYQYLTAGSFEYRPVKVEIKRPVIMGSRAVTAGEAQLVPETIAFRDDELGIYRKPGARLREKKLRDENLDSIRQKAARLPADPYALYLLSEAEWSAGNVAEAGSAADRLLAIQPNHPRAMVTKSLTLATAAAALAGPARDEKATEARRLALRANKADPNDALALVAYYQSFHLVGAKPPKAAVDGLFAAVLTLPADIRIRQLLVDELAAERRWAEAIAVLMPIANSPHDSPRRTAAQEQMAKLQAELAKERGAPAAS